MDLALPGNDAKFSKHHILPDQSPHNVTYVEAENFPQLQSDGAQLLP
jgi:hypothetical protein